LTRIGTVDQVLLLLREQLERTGRNRGATGHRAASAGRGEARPLERARSLAALDALSDEDAGRVLVRGLLAEQFGDALGNDLAFQNIIEEVFGIIAETPDGRDLIARALGQLRQA
jgi:hypothetical protein